MQYRTFNNFIFVVFISAVLSACGNDSSDKSAAQVTETGDVIAHVGDEVITFSQLDAVLDSAAEQGAPVPPPGTPERSQLMLALLDKAISANLIYLDAKKKGSDKQPLFQEDVKQFENDLLAAMYQSDVMIGEVPVGDVEVIHYYNTQTSKEMELTDELKLAIEDRIRQQKIQDLQASLRTRLRENVEVVINEEVLSPDYDDKRKDTDTVATDDKQPIAWSQVKELMQLADQSSSMQGSDIDKTEERLNQLELYIDDAIMTQKGREFGLQKDPVYIDRMAEYQKEHLINEYSKELIRSWIPAEDELKAFYTANSNMIVIPAARRVQAVVVASKEQAESIKAQLDAGTITMSEAAQQYSIEPDAKSTQGDRGWVKQGAGAEGLDTLIFSLETDVVAGPVESGAGWQLLKVLDVSDAQFENFDDMQTQNRTLKAYMQGRFTDYIAELRKNQFKVVVYDDVFSRQFQQQIKDNAELNNKADPEAAVTEQPDQKSHPWMVKPAAE